MKIVKWLTTGQNTAQDLLFDVAADPSTGDLYAVGRSYGTWPGQAAANTAGQIMMAKVLYNSTLAYVKLHGSTGLSYPNSVAFND